MKKIICSLIICTVMISFSSEKSYSEYKKTSAGKIGTSYASDLDNFGLDLNFSCIYEIDKWFTAGFDAGFFWLPWERKLWVKDTGDVKRQVVSSTDLYSFPVMLDANINLPFLEKKIYVKPYVTVGLGYTFMILSYKKPASEGTESHRTTNFYSGYSWQIIPGVSYSPSSDSKIRFLGELGYRSINTKKGSENVDMSGVIFRAGVQFFL